MKIFLLILFILSFSVNSYSDVQNIEVTDFGARGDGISDDTAAFKAALAKGRGKVIQVSKATYRVTDRLSLPPGCTILANGATFNASIADGRVLFDMNNDTKLFDCVINMTSPPGGDGSKNIPLKIGDYASGKGINNVNISGVRINGENLWKGSNGILVTGESKDIVIQDMEINGAGNISRGILVHWGGADNPEVRTTHPHGIRIEGIKAANLNREPTAAAVFISGAYDCIVKDLTSFNCPATFEYFSGDYGSEFASPWEKKIIGTGIIVTGLRAYEAKAVIKVEGMATKVKSLQAASVRFNDCEGIGTGINREGGTGILLTNCNGVVVEKCSMTNFAQSGLAVGENVKNLIIKYGNYSNNGSAGIYLQNTISQPEKALVSGISAYKNGLNENTPHRSAGIVVNGRDCIITGCSLGTVRGETQLYGIISTDGINLTAFNNKCFGFAPGGSAFAFGSTLKPLPNLKTQDNRFINPEIIKDF